MKAEVENRYRLYEPFYRAAVEKAVCDHCVDRAEDGRCGTHDAEDCAVMRYLPEMVRIAVGLHAQRIEPYASRVRRRVCNHCPNSAEGCCGVREKLDCGLDRYLPMVVSALDEVNARFGLYTPVKLAG